MGDRLKRRNDAGDLDENAREKLVLKLGGEISAVDERRYTHPSLYPAITESPQAEEARSGLLAGPADPRAGLTVLFGPGGIVPRSSPGPYANPSASDSDSEFPLRKKAVVLSSKFLASKVQLMLQLLSRLLGGVHGCSSPDFRGDIERPGRAATPSRSI
jgi:hypothetical protein